MIRKFACAVFILGLGFSLAVGEEFGASIKSIKDGKVTFAKRDKDKKEGEEMTLPLADKVKVLKSKFNKETMKPEAGDELKDGLKNEIFAKIGEKGVRATIVTDEDGKKITEIRVFGGGDQKKKKKKDA